LREILVWVPVMSFCKIFIPSYTFDALLCRNWPFLPPPNRVTLQITLLICLISEAFEFKCPAHFLWWWVCSVDTSSCMSWKSRLVGKWRITIIVGDIWHGSYWEAILQPCSNKQ
jgi:hypothetical protein